MVSRNATNTRLEPGTSFAADGFRKTSCCDEAPQAQIRSPAVSNRYSRTTGWQATIGKVGRKKLGSKRASRIQSMRHVECVEAYIIGKTSRSLSSMDFSRLHAKGVLGAWRKLDLRSSRLACAAGERLTTMPTRTTNFDAALRRRFTALEPLVVVGATNAGFGIRFSSLNRDVYR